VKRLVLVALLVLAGCGPEQPTVMASTPAMVSVCARMFTPMSVVVATAQAQCRRNGKDATLTGRGRCFGSMMDINPSDEYDFRCE